MPTRFKVVKKDNENYCAVALYSFENLATGRVVDEGEESGCFDSPNTISQDGTAWIFPGSKVRESFISGDCGIINSKIFHSFCSGSVLLISSSITNCNLTYGEFSGSTIVNMDMSYNYSDEKTNKKHLFFIKASSINLNGSTEIYGNLQFQNTVINTCTSDFSNVSLFNCNIVGRDIDVSNSDIHNVVIKSNIKIADSVISFPKKIKKANPIESESLIAICNADISSPAQLRIISCNSKAFCGYRDNSYDYVICIGYCEPYTVKVSNYFEKLPKRQKNNIFCEWFAANKTVNSFVDDEANTIKRLFPTIANDIAAIKQVLLFDLLCLYMEDRTRTTPFLYPNLSLLQLDAVGFEQDMIIDISNSSIVAPKTHFFFSKLVKETILNLTNFSEKEVTNMVMSIGKEKKAFHYLSF